MPHNRFYTDSILNQGDAIDLIDSEFHHLMVSRAMIGQSVELMNGKGQLALATLIALKKRHAILEIESFIQCEGKEELSIPIILAQALPRMNHLEWIVEKATELGVTSFWFFSGMLSEKSMLSDHQQSRLANLAIAALKQCGRLTLPTFAFKPPLKKWAPIEGTLLYGDASSTSPFLWNLSFKIVPPVILFIGPESGFDAQEIHHLNDVLGAKQARFHSNTLRAETASLVALSLLYSICK